MKLDIKTDFTQLPRAESFLRADKVPADAAAALGVIALAHDERQLRRKVLQTTDGQKILVDLLEAVELRSGDRLVLEDRRTVEIADADEELLEISGRDLPHLLALSWALGSQQVAMDASAERILILRNGEIGEKLRHLGAQLIEVSGSFHPLPATQARHGHMATHHHDHAHHHDHGPNCGCGHHH